MQRSYSRRKFINQCFRSGVALLSIGSLSMACDSKIKSGENKILVNSCEDYSGVSEGELEKRKKFAYAKPATDPAKQCTNCKLFLPPKQGEKCGACSLFKGPVDANASCTYWAPLD
jgi:hypothetical protein